ncbi:metal ABC transporter solute-binding protein, Zn/Mn family [Helcococcus bovis]|uniref:metal ABC transporter solute-binding protein, Zn/Mn family n=1 Tax=Helcococcus bovis TaxID=3153252 RepID=UPI0038B9D424
MMNKRINIFALLLVFCIILTSCGQKNNQTSKSDSKTEITKESNSKEGKKLIYTTFFPVTDLTKMIVGDKMEVKTIIKGSEEPHSFELKTDDMKSIIAADLVVYNGANMESFIPDLEKAVGNKDKFLNLSQGLTLLKQGDGLNESNDMVNPHTWLSVKNAIEQLDTIYKKLSSIDPENESYYKANLEKAQEKFKELDKKFETELAKVNKKDKYFVVSHAAFNYLANDYGLKQVAVTGISPEDEPSAKQLKTIADFVKKNNISTIFFEGKATPKVAETLAKNTNTKTSTMYTMENLTEEEAQMGYLKLMELNLKALMESFND